jgi:hypothetical protein
VETPERLSEILRGECPGSHLAGFVLARLEHDPKGDSERQERPAFLL